MSFINKSELFKWGVQDKEVKTENVRLCNIMLEQNF